MGRGEHQCPILSRRLEPVTGIDGIARAHPRRVPAGARAELARGRPRVRSGAVRLHLPEPGPLPWQWYWDSCFTAITWRRFEPDAVAPRARDAPRRAARATGSSGTRSSGTRRSPAVGGSLQRASRRPDDAQASSRRCWRGRGGAVGDPRRYPRSSATDWLSANRDLDGDGLLWIVQPDESGLDASPQFDAIWGRRAQRRPVFILLVGRNRGSGTTCAGSPAPAAGRVRGLTNVLYGLSLLALGRPSLTPTIVERMYDEVGGLFVPLVRPAPKRRRRAPGRRWRRWPCRTCPRRSAGGSSRSTCLTSTRFWLPVPPPSVPLDEPGFSLRETTAVDPALLARADVGQRGVARVARSTRLGSREAADARRAARVRGAGAGVARVLRPRTGRGMGARDFGWSTLVMEMLDPAT